MQVSQMARRRSGEGALTSRMRALGGDEELALIKKELGFDPEQSFEVSDEVIAHTRAVAERSDADKKATRQYVEAQLDAYERHTGWIYWTWKAESAPEWAMDTLLSAGLFPQPLTERQYPNQCSGATY